MRTYKEFLNEAKQSKVGCIVKSRLNGRGSKRHIGSLQELTSEFAYTLEVGKEYEGEKGNSKINLKPKTFKALSTALNKAVGNSGKQGIYEYDDCTEEEMKKYSIEGSFIG